MYITNQYNHSLVKISVHIAKHTNQPIVTLSICTCTCKPYISRYLPTHNIASISPSPVRETTGKDTLKEEPIPKERGSTALDLSYFKEHTITKNVCNHLLHREGFMLCQN